MSYSELTEELFTIGQGQPSTHTNKTPLDEKPQGETQEYYNGQFDQLKIVDEILDRWWILTVDNKIYVYDDLKGYYIDNGKRFIKAFTEKALAQHFKRRYAEEVVYQIEARTFRRAEDMEPPLNLVNVKNGILDLETGELERHSPHYFFTNALNADYDKKAEYPQFQKFLSEITGTKEDQLTLQEYTGYTMLRNYHHQKALALIGSGANGKSTFLNTTKTLLGYGNISGLSLQQIGNNRFALARLYKKLANIYPDLTASALRETGPFKMVTGGDPLEAEVKFYQETVQFTNYAKLMFSANTLPTIPEDDSDAFFRRWILITFPNKFEGENADKKILEKFTAELSGILNWALEGLRRLEKKGGFTYSLTTEEIRDQYQRMASSVYAFLEDHTEYDPEGWVGKDYFYNEYIRYCIDQNLPRKSKSTLSKEMPTHMPAVIPKKQRVGGEGQIWGWHGIRILSDEEKPPHPQTKPPTKLGDFTQ